MHRLLILLLGFSLSGLGFAAQRPNILFIFSDDHRHDLVGSTNPLVQTPHLDSLAASGVRFTHACVTTAICSPSRAAVLSGQYGSRNGVPTLSDPLNHPSATVAHALAEADYRTIQIGKWHLGTNPTDAGFQQFARINSNGSWFQRNINTNIPGAPTKLNGTFYETVMADLVIDRISDHLNNHATEPFFLWWCNQVPHVDGGLKYRDVKTDPNNKVEQTPAGSPGGYRANYDLATMPVPANWSDDFATKPPYLPTSRFVTKSATENYGGPGGYTNPNPGVRNATLGEDHVQQHNLEYFASISALDAEIGRVLAHLDDPNGDGDTADSITDNTWIIFMGDNGWQTGSHKFTSKVLAYDESIRVPLIIKAPGVAPRTESNLALNIDLPPLFHCLADIPAAGHHQGRNLRSLIENPTTNWRDHLYYEATTPEPSLGAEPHDALRTTTHKLIRTYDNNSNLTFEELYDLTTDPGEMTNLADDPAHAATKTTLTNLLLAERNAIAASPNPVGASSLINPSFDTGDKVGWTTNGNDTSTVVTSPLDGGSHALQFNSGSSSSWVQQLGFSLQDFTSSWHFRYTGSIDSRVMNVHARSNNNDRLNIRINPSGQLQFYNGSAWTTPTGVTGSNNFLPDVAYLFTLESTAWGNPTSTDPAAGTYTLSWTDLHNDATSGSYSSVGQSNNGYRYAAPNTLEDGEFQGLRFLDDFGSNADPAWLIDGVSIANNGTPPPPPPVDKVVNISGVYPHLAMTNNSNECGPGAVVPFANRLWCVTYSPHEPNGSSSKLYEIDSNLTRIIRPESLGGTPANRFIHQPSNQLIIGPHFIDSNRNVRNLPYSSAPGRHTGVASHLTDPANRVYIMTMENGLYDINVNDLSFITRYPDIQGRGDRFLFGYHGKGLYSGQGLLVASNNGRPNNQGTPTGDAGVLATWDGTTVADNGGSYFSTNDPNTAEPSNNPVAPQPEYIAGWDQIDKVQTCEVTGPGDIFGNPNPATDPIWTTAFDAKSILLRTLENGTWHTFRLPKGSYSHDGSHGWHTEWPRIRQLDPENEPSSPYLMHMHGLFYDFPADFSATNFGQLTPLCGYYKMPVDYCTFNGQLVIAKNDASKFSNALAPKAQSNFWFGQLSDLQDWGAPTGHGALWMNEAVTANQTSDPFLLKGFTHRTLHLRNEANTALDLTLQTSSGNGTWTTLKILTLPANSALHDNLSDTTQPWFRLQASANNADLTAFFHLSNPYPHAPIASLATDKFAALADIKDSSGYSDGLIRVMTGDDLKLEFASDSGYHQIAGDMILTDINNPALEADLRTDAALSQEFGSDNASAWIESGGTRFRVPKLDPAYDAPFLSGWARGEREAVTERKLFNLHGTFYEIPRNNSGGVRKMRALSTHGKRITDFASWRGLFVLTGVLDDAPASDHLIKNKSGNAALWLGEVDDLWQMGEPRGTGGPWLDTPVTANTPSDPFLMYGYDRKELTLSHTSASPVTFTLELDILADNTWSTHQTFTVAPGETFTHLFPEGFHAHWVRISSDTTTTASSQFTYGPSDQRDSFLDWGRDNNLPTASGREALATSDHDQDGSIAIAEFLFNTSPLTQNELPYETSNHSFSYTLRNTNPAENITPILQSSSDLVVWTDTFLTLDPDQSSTSSGFSKYTHIFTLTPDLQFHRLKIEF